MTPSFNQARFLERTIRSVLDQRYPNLEYIIMDGGSTDGSVEIIEKHEAALAYWVSEKDDGQADAIRKGFEKSTGEILAWLNSDDMYEPGALLKVAQAFQRHPKADLIFGDYWLIDEEDRKITDIRHPDFSFETLVYVGGSLHQTAAFWTREAYERVGGVNPKYAFCMDFDLFCRMGERGTFVHIPAYLANFRVHPTSKSNTLMDQGRSEHLEICRRYVPPDQPTIVCRLIAIKCELRRAMSFVRAGDIRYVAQKMLRRLARSLSLGARRE